MNLGKPGSSAGNVKENLYKKLFACVLVLAMSACPVMPAFVWNSAAREWRAKDRITKTPGPEFQETETRVVVMAGRDAILPCRITNLNDKVWIPPTEANKALSRHNPDRCFAEYHDKLTPGNTNYKKLRSRFTQKKMNAITGVSWIRTKDLHILTSGPVTFTADDRFEGNHVKGSADWSLRLRKAQVSDSGVYDCQINTDPKINRNVTLDVVSDFNDLGDTPSNDLDLYMVEDEGIPSHKAGGVTRVLGEEEQYVKTGSTITFTCIVIIPGETVTSVDWLKNGRLISFQASRGGIIVETEKTEKKATSRLTVADVRTEDSGNYTCKPSNAKSHSVALVVVEGEHIQAMQRNTNSSQRSCVNRTFFIYTSCLILTLLYRHS